MEGIVGAIFFLLFGGFVGDYLALLFFPCERLPVQVRYNNKSLDPIRGVIPNPLNHLRRQGVESTGDMNAIHKIIRLPKGIRYEMKIGGLHLN